MKTLGINSRLLFLVLCFAWASCEDTDSDNDAPGEETDTSDSNSDGQDTSSTDSDLDAGVGVDSGPPSVAGSGNECASYALPANGMCGSYYCGVNLETLAKEIDPTALCGKDPEFTCYGNVVTAVGACSRKVKSQNLREPNNDVLRPLVEACVYEDEEIKARVEPDCLSCFIDAADCAGLNCMTQCLTGDSPLCDNCRKNNNCEAPVFTCAGLPSPF